MRSVHLAHRLSKRRGAVTASKIGPEGASDTLRFQCPNTGREVDSGVDAHCGARLISIRVLCPLCEDLHEWQITGRNLGIVLSAEDQSSDAQLNKTRKGPPGFRGQNPELIELREQLLEETNQRLKNNLQVLYGGSGEVSRWNNGPERVAFSDSRINKMPRDSRSVLDKRILARTSGRCRGARRADHVDERAQRSRDLSPPGIIEEQSLERRRPVFEHAYQLPGTLERLGHSFDCIRNP